MNKQKHERMQRAEYRSKQRRKDLMWEKLSNEPRRRGVFLSPGVQVTVVDEAWILPVVGCE